jgi:cytochrome P450
MIRFESPDAIPSTSRTRCLAAFRPPSLDLPDEAVVRWTSLTKIIRLPEQNWPAQICARRIITGRVGDRATALIADPEAAKIVLGGSEAEFPKWRIYERVVGTGVGRESILAVAGAKWRRQRRAFGPAFRPENVAQLVPLFRRAGERAMATWNTQGNVVRLDAWLEMTRLSLDVIWRVLFGADAETDPPPIVARAAEQIHAAQLHGDLDGPPRFLAQLADEAARSPCPRGAIADNPFGAWGAASGDRSDEGLTDQEMYDNARGFFGAGHETTALTLTWALWLVAHDDASQQRLHAEIDRIVGPGPIEDAHIERLAFTGQVLSETLRLIPPAPVTVRQSTAAVELAGERLPAGSVLVVCIYALHRHRDWWQEPDLFRPERFAPGSGEPRHRYAYLPFSAGRHACIGANLAWKEAVTIFAGILQHFRLAPGGAAPIRPRVLITLRPDREVPIVLHRRR